jgi:phospholipase/lecithinase/hemolysin
MRLSTLSRCFGTIAAASLVFAAAPAAASATLFSGLYVFGDSLSDNGNLFALTGGAFPPAPYYQGRFSNGPVAAEVLANRLGLLPSQFHDMAIGGAQTGTGGQFPGSGMLNQVAGFGSVLAGANADGGALYMVWGGANDLRGGVSIADVISNLSSIVTTLHGFGATKFLLPNLPDLGLTPEAREASDVAPGVTASAAASGVSTLFNQQLAMAYGDLAALWGDEQFYYADAFGAQHAITDGSPGNGFSNVSSGCITTLGCNPANFLYWDQIHPTAAAHQILGDQMLAAVSVPEPQAMLLTASALLIMLGFSRRRQV